jgi:hypothetical protein
MQTQAQAGVRCVLRLGADVGEGVRVHGIAGMIVSVETVTMRVSVTAMVRCDAPRIPALPDPTTAAPPREPWGRVGAVVGIRAARRRGG